MTHPNKRRKDHLTRKLLDIVARIADRGDHKAAVEVCVGENIPFEVAHRIITRPSQRRTFQRTSQP